MSERFKPQEARRITDLTLDHPIEAGRLDPEGFTDFWTEFMRLSMAQDQKTATERRLGRTIEGWPMNNLPPLIPGQEALIQDVANAAIAGCVDMEEARADLLDNLYTYKADSRKLLGE